MRIASRSRNNLAKNPNESPIDQFAENHDQESYEKPSDEAANQSIDICGPSMAGRVQAKPKPQVDANHQTGN
jgi:hypothetical protein